MSPREGRVALIVGPLLFLILVLGAVLVARHLDRQADEAGFGIVETNRIGIDLEGASEGWSAWLDPTWSELLAERLAGIRNFRADDTSGVEEVVAALQEFSFVQELGVPRVIWPDGLDVPLRLRRPLACIAHRGRFYPVAVDWQGAAGPRGVILPGGGLTPPTFRGAFLPVIGGLKEPIESVYLEDPVVLGALSVADSLWTELDPGVATALGRIVIDATKDAEASVEEPGTRIELEGGRLIYFGRSPYLGAAGELPVATKWANLEKAMNLLDAGKDWNLLDLRWDQPDIRLLPPLEEAPEGLEPGKKD